MASPCGFASLLLVMCLVGTEAKTIPEQIHLSLGGKSSEMIVTFTVFSTTEKATVKYSKVGGSESQANTEVTKFKDTNGYKAYVHRAVLIGLEPNQTYEYQCSTDDNWSAKYQFKTFPADIDSPVRVAVVADMGLEEENGVSIPQLKKDVKNRLYDSIFHIGDIAYNLNKDSGSYGDKFLNQIQDIAASVPYQVCPGNHERKRNFTHYVNRFSMIDRRSNERRDHYYSLDIGSAHFVFYSTELYYYPEFFTDSHIKWQYEWLENDLKEATKAENRAQRPWVIVMAHRPMYCLTNDANAGNDEDSDVVNGVDKDCFNFESITRSGKSGADLKQTSPYGLEDMFYKYGVDVQLYGHKHLYARSYPTYNFQTEKSYANPKSPVHIITGVGGTTDRPSIKTSLPDWVSSYRPDYGFTRMTIQNKTHIFFEQFSVEKDKVVDSFVLSKERNGRQTV